MVASSNPFQRGSWGWGMFIHGIHDARGENGSSWWGCLCDESFASKKSSEREFFVPAGTHLAVKLFITFPIFVPSQHLIDRNVAELFSSNRFFFHLNKACHIDELIEGQFRGPKFSQLSVSVTVGFLAKNSFLGVFCVLNQNRRLVAARAMQCEHLPNGGIQWLLVKPGMCTIEWCAPYCTAAHVRNHQRFMCGSRQFDMSHSYFYSGPTCQLEPFFTMKFRACFWLVISERVLARWRRLVAFMKATNLLH